MYSLTFFLIMPLTFQTEAELVAAYRSYLQFRSIATQSEVSCGRGFAADLVSAQTVWECKLTLDRDHLYQAFGQVESYRRKLGKPKAAIFGLSPIESKQRQQAHRIADWLRSVHPHLWVLFVDSDPHFERFCHGKNQSLTKISATA